jgi:hypothetical protein
LQIVIDVDAALRGKAALKFKPSLTLHMLENSRVNLDLLIDGKNVRVGRFWIVNTKFGQVDLQTN